MKWHHLWIIPVCFTVFFIVTVSYWINMNFNIKPSPTPYNHKNPVIKKSGYSKISPNKMSSMWTIWPGGRFGNFMGQYATLFALAKLNGQQAFILPTMHYKLARVFKVRLPVMDMEVTSRMMWKLRRLHDWMAPEYGNISEQYVKFFGKPCSWTFFHHIRDEILREFAFHDFIKEEVNDYLVSVTGDLKHVTYVGVHVRRGNYVHIMSNERKGVVADSRYLQKAMDYFRYKYDNPLFVVTSDDMDWCKENINNSLGDVHFAGDGNDISPDRDFALLAHCNHTIMTLGTFGFWAAYLAGGETIYLANFTLPDSPLLRKFKYEAAYLPEWIGIPADLSLLTSNKTL
ncbi:galactoside alpha-(1,2)-fucosyltransferase 1-like [Mixophyes fleayi]|uniref:galactoside alpha-(1,2)-fucosyltransferase 1-like n=1 Tax=Mixophyes fleayi TaxID=3061075 RepID=UPI003F4D8ED8